MTTEPHKRTVYIDYDHQVTGLYPDKVGWLRKQVIYVGKNYEDCCIWCDLRGFTRLLWDDFVRFSRAEIWPYKLAHSNIQESTQTT